MAETKIETPELFPGYRDMRLKSLARLTVEMLGVNSATPDADTILEHSVHQAIDELECCEKALRAWDETSPLLSTLASIRHRLQLVVDQRDLLAALVAIPPIEEVEAAK